MKRMAKQFGGKVTRELKQRYAGSQNWRDDKFQNLVETSMEFSVQDMPKILYQQLIATKGRSPKTALPIQVFDQEAFLSPSPEPKFIWYGHSVLLMRWMHKTILIDPMFGPDAAPIAPFTSKRYSENTLDIIDQLPEVDLLLMTHDHYDHLDLASIEKLMPKTRQWFTALGVGRHLESWGVNPAKILEFDWWDSQEYEGIEFVFTPSRHFSGRGLKDRAKSLWGGWVMNGSDHKLYWSGDGGYGDHFAEVGKAYGPFDFGFMECGQYNQHWHQIHMYPEEAVQAALDAGVKRALPVHWGAFALALHTWKDPIERFVAEAELKALDTCTPRLGELVGMSSKTSDWWSTHQ